MEATQVRNARLPIKRNLTLIYALTFVITVLMAAASIAGLMYRTVIYPTDELLRALVSLDVINLCLGLPILLGSMWLARRGRLIGLLCWPGALFFVLYTYLIYVFAMPINVAFLLHLALVTLSMYTVIGLVASIDGKTVQGKLAGVVPERVAGAALAGQGLLMIVWVTAAIINALAGGTTVAETGPANHFTDVLITPAWIIGGILLWRRQALGYVTGLGLLLQGSMFILAAMIIMLRQSFVNAAPVALTNVGVIFAGGLVGFIPFALYARGVVSKKR